MEPGHEDREYVRSAAARLGDLLPQWSPVMKTGNTRQLGGVREQLLLPQWSPVMKTGNTRQRSSKRTCVPLPQWSPVMKIGNTAFEPPVLSQAG